MVFEYIPIRSFLSINCGYIYYVDITCFIWYIIVKAVNPLLPNGPQRERLAKILILI